MTKMAWKAVGAATAGLYTGTTPTLAKLITMTAGTRAFLSMFIYMPEIGGISTKLIKTF